MPVVYVKTFLTQEENRIVELKYAKPTIGSLSPEDRLTVGKLLLLQIHVITGWVIPASEELMIILTDQFVKHIGEKYSNLNQEEVEYAFRTYGTTVEDWGKDMNLNLIDKILLPYFNKRYEISEIERKIKDKPDEQKIYSQDELDNLARQDVNWVYGMFLRGQVLKNPEANRPILQKDNLIKETESVSEFLKRKADAGFLNIYMRDEN